MFKLDGPKLSSLNVAQRLDEMTVSLCCSVPSAIYRTFVCSDSPRKNFLSQLVTNVSLFSVFETLMFDAIVTLAPPQSLLRHFRPSPSGF